MDRLGAGDSFAAGLIHGLLDGDLQKVSTGVWRPAHSSIRFLAISPGLHGPKSKTYSRAAVCGLVGERGTACP